MAPMRTTKKIECTESMLCIDFPGILNDISVGEEILINDGAIRLKIESIHKAQKQASCRVLTTGVYSSQKGVNFPNAKLSVPSFTAKDKIDLAFILTQNVQFVALSFVRRKADILPLASIIKKSGKHIKLIIKIEKPEALEHLEAIVAAADGVMVARGDLGVETDIARVAVAQKEIIAACRRHRKPVIVATQMLDSMQHSRIPTRAEAETTPRAE